MVVLHSFLVTRRQTSKVLEAIDGTFHPIPQAVDRPVKRPGAPLIGLARNGVPDPPSPQVRANRPTAVALVAHPAAAPQPGPPAARPLDRALFQQLLKHCALVLFARGEHEGQRLAGAVDPQVNCGAEPALTPAQRFGLWVPFFAPAAGWGARTTVAST